MAKIRVKNLSSKFKSLKGVSTKDILNMDVYKLKKPALKQVVNRLVSSANKRLRRLYEKAPDSPALRKHLTERGALKPFTSKGLKTRNQYESLMKSLRTFLKTKTSTIKGFQESRTNIIKRIGEFKDKAQEKEFWEIYNKWIDSHPNEFNRANFKDTNELQAMFYDEFVIKGRTARGTSNVITRTIKKMISETTAKKVQSDLAMENDLENGNAIRIESDF